MTTLQQDSELVELTASDVTDGKGLPFRDIENPHQQVWIKDKRWLSGLPMAYFLDELPVVPGEPT